MTKPLMLPVVLALLLFTSLSSNLAAIPILNLLDYPGCTNPNACNFDPGATVDDGSCLFENCIALNNDTYCFNDGDLPEFNVLDNDILPPGYNFGSFGNDPCVFIDPLGYIRLTGTTEADCCGDHTLYYFITNADGSIGFDGTAVITIKCANDCANIDLSTLLTGGTDPAGGGEQGPEECIHVCEFSNTTFTFPYTPADILVWDVPVGGSGVIGANPGEYIVTWGPNGTGLITLTVISNGVPTNYSFCIDIMDGPPAFFTGPTAICLSQTASFTASSGADEYHWDFGDATYGTGQTVTHSYATAGTYTVTLTTVGYNFDEAGNPLCSCTSTYTQEVVVEDLPGPDILWVSTLCDGDFTKYWTSASSCASYVWTVNDSDGNPVSFIGNGNDTICVTWPLGSGPFATVTLAVTGCDDAYCSIPTSVTIPIIPAVGDIEGEIIVCEGSTSIYSLPKWVNTVYNWSVTGNGTIVSSNGGHQIEVMWGSAGIGHIHVDYHSEFLAGLPEHEGSDCYGSADLDVSILPVFTLNHDFYSNTVCKSSTTTFTATSFPFTTYSWTITPAIPFNVTGPNTISVDWNIPGNYVVTATPDDGTVFCNTSQSIVIRVIEVQAPIGIDGETSICLNTNYFYSAVSAAPGYSYNWTVSPGGIISGFGQTVQVQWTTPGAHWLSVTHVQFTPVYCESDPFILNVVEKSLPVGMAISGGALCSNSLESYILSPAPDPEATIVWLISPAIAGSVVGGQGTINPQVQWNNYNGPVTLEAQVTLCGVTQSVFFFGTINIPIVPVITQLGNLCPGVNATLQTTVPFASYSWSPGGQVTPTILISSEGNYSVTTVDFNGCSATGYYTANEIDGPTANITSGDNPTICFTNPHNVTMVTPTNGSYIIEWWCNGILVSGPSLSSTYTHLFQGNAAISNYNYQVFVIDPNTGCEKWSDIFVVNEFPICPGGCASQPYFCNISANPNCNQGQFTAFGSNFTVVSWSFGDGFLGGGNPVVHNYLQAGCYNVQLTIAVPNIVPGDPDCIHIIDSSICIPLAVDFDIDYVGCGTVDFTNLSSWIAGPGNAITSYTWDFGDLTPFGSGTNVTHVYANAGSYPVTLTVTNGNGCVSSITKNVNITSVGTPTLNYSPLIVCVNEPVNFTSFASNAVTYTWNFGDGATFVGPNPAHTYTSVPLGGSATVTVTATDADGCTKTSSITFPVNPAPTGSIFAPITIICEGDLAILQAPPGYTYQWLPNNQVTQSISVGAGTYSVILTNAFGCSYETDPVTIEEIPLPDVSISGRLIICDAGCVTLTATYGDGWLYEWFDDLGNLLGTNTTLQVCSGSLANGYIVKVTNQFGCTNSAGPVVVTVKNSPVFNVSVAGTLCEGDPTTLTVTPNLPNWTYSWSGGGNLPVKVVTQLGNHTVTVTDIDSGCSASHTEVVNPKPDFCAVPAGCYTACNPDTICGDPGMTSYQWNLNGTPITGETNQCIIVTTSGNYTVTETNSFNCTDTSQPLILNLIDCSEDPCDSLTVDYSFLVSSTNEVDSCCLTLSYNNGFGPLLGLSITSSDASLVFSNVNPLLQIQSVVPNGIELASIIPTGSIPLGNLNNVVTFCMTNVTSSPQEVIINWYDMEAEIICPDTIIFNCPVEPDCLYLTNDSIYCDGVETIYQFTVCNPNDADWDVSYISLLPTSPSGITLSPSGIDLTGSPLMPGQCATFTIALGGIDIGGETFCFNIVAHKENPALNPDALCCSIDTLYCIDIPFCDPCGFVYVSEVLPTEDCCYQTILHNDFSDSYFDAIDLCVISPQTTFTVNNPFGSGWTTNAYTPTTVTLLPTGFSNFAPLGDFALPEICIQTSIAPFQLVEVKWMHDGEVVCRDTLSLFCEPDCGYFINDLVQCNDDGTWSFNADLVNTAPYSIAEAVITFSPSSGLSAYNQVVSLGSIPTGGIFSSINFNIGAPAQPGDEICFTVTLHEINSDGLYLNCCNFTYCMVLPDCGFVPPCVCDESFFSGAQQGISCVQDGPLSYSYDFNLISNVFQDCDQVRWYFPGVATPIILPGGVGVSYTFPGPGSYEVCAKIYRTAPDGTICKTSVCKTVIITGIPNLAVFPNPNNGAFNISFTESTRENIDVRVYDSASRPVFVRTFVSENNRNVIEIDMKGAAPGMYYVQIQSGDQIVVEKVSVN